MNTNYKIQATRYQFGFTIIELLVVIGITVILASIGSATYLGLRDRERIDQMANRIAADTRATMARAQSQEGGQQWGIHFDNTTPSSAFYAIWYGASYATGTVVQKVSFVSTGVSFTNPASGNSTDVVFTKPNGLPASPVSITVSSSATSAAPRTINIDANGTLLTGGTLTVTSPTATSITTSSATLGANVASDGGGSVTNRGTCWGISPSPAVNCLDEGGTTTGVFTHSRTGLPSGTLVYYRGYATNAVGTSYSTGGTFSTSGAPTLTSPTATNITLSTATLGANLTSNGGSTITARGTCWGTSDAPTTNCNPEGGTSLGVFTMPVTGLPSSTLIYYRGYATTANGTGYSTDGTFTTSGPLGRYWVGGTGNWSDATNHWATSSGGAPGSGNLPTANDSVVFDSASYNASYTVTIDTAAVCIDMTWGNPSSGTPTLAGSSALTISGSLSLVSGMGRTYTGAITFNSTATGKTITTNGVALASSITFNGINGGWQFQDNLTFGVSARTLTLTNGLLNINGETIATSTGYWSFSSSNSNTRTLTLGAATLNNLGTWDISTSSGMTLSPNTASLNFPSGSNFYGGGLTNYYNVSLTGTATITMSGSNTFNNLTFITFTGSNAIAFLGANQTVNGTFTANGIGLTYRIFIRSNTLGTPRTITAAAVSISNVDFQDITGAGAGTWSGASIGDALGNSGITFTTPVTRYWVATSGGSWSVTSSWSATSGGGNGASVPLPQDTVYINANSITSTGRTITANMPRLGKDIDFTGVLNSPTLNFTVAPYIFGKFVLVPGMTVSGGQQISLQARSAVDFDPAGVSITNQINIQGINATYTLKNNLIITQNASNYYLKIDNGTFNANNYSVTVPVVSSQSGYTRTIIMGSGIWTVTATGTVWDISVAGLTLTPGASTIKISDVSATAKTSNGAGLIYNNIWLTGTGTGSYTISGSNTFNDFKDDNSAAHSILFTAGATQTVNTFTVSGTAGNLITINSTSTSTHSLVKSGGGTISCNYLNIQHSVATPASTWHAGANSTNNQSVPTAGSGWIFP